MKREAEAKRDVEAKRDAAARSAEGRCGEAMCGAVEASACLCSKNQLWNEVAWVARRFW